MIDLLGNVQLLYMPYSLESGVHIWFDSEVEQSTFFKSIEYRLIDDTSYIKNLSSIKVNIGFDELHGNVNYLTFQNNIGKKMCCYILNMQYVNPNTTLINFSVDVIQTYMFDMDLSQLSYIDRRHYSAKNDSVSNLMMLPQEDLEVGSEYDLIDRRNITSPDSSLWYLLVSTEPLNGVQSNGSRENTYHDEIAISENNGVYTYSTTVENESNRVISMLHYYVCSTNAISKMVAFNFFTKTHIQGKVVQWSVLPLTTEQLIGTRVPTNLYHEITGMETGEFDFIHRANEIYRGSQYINIENPYLLLNDYINRVLNDVPDAPLVDDYEVVYPDPPKNAIGLYLYKYPYSILETNDYLNNIKMYKNEYVNNNRFYQLLVNKEPLKYVYSISLANVSEVRYALSNYQTKLFVKTREKGVSFNDVASEYSSILQSYVNIPIVSDYTSAYLQSNANQIQQQKMNIESTLANSLNTISTTTQASMNSALTGQENAQIGAQNAVSNTAISNNATLSTAGINGAVGGVGAIGQLLSGNLGGSINGVISAGASFANANISVGASESVAQNNYATALQQANNSLQAQQYSLNISEANSKRLANLTASQSIANLNAKINDIKNVPNSISVSGNGSPFNYLFNLNIISMNIKSVKFENMKRLVNYFNLYGFKSNSLESLESIIIKFDVGCYVRTKNANVMGKIPNDYLNAIKLTFDSGVMIFKGAENLYNWKGVKEQ